MKTKYYIVWVEGFCLRTGDKIKSLTRKGHEYTSYMTEAMRVRAKDREWVKRWLVTRGVSEGYIDFVETSYVPKGTLFNP